MSTEEHNPKTFAREPYASFNTALSILKLSPSELCEQLGYPHNAHHGWKKYNNMPVVASRLCKALVTLHKQNTVEPSTDVVLLVRIPKIGHSRELIEHLTKSLSLEFTVI